MKKISKISANNTASAQVLIKKILLFRSRNLHQYFNKKYSNKHNKHGHGMKHMKLFRFFRLRSVKFACAIFRTIFTILWLINGIKGLKAVNNLRIKQAQKFRRLNTWLIIFEIFKNLII